MKKERRDERSKEEKKVLFFSELGGAHKKQRMPVVSGAVKTTKDSEKWTKIRILSDQPYRSTEVEIITLPAELSKASGEKKEKKPKRKDRR